MNARLLLTMLLLASALSLSAQKYKVDTVFYNQTGEVIKGEVTEYSTFEIRAVDKKGRIQGSSIRYTKTGRVVELTYYNKGEKNGEYERYNPLGNVMVSGVFDKDKRVGAWATMDVKGKIIQVTDYGDKGDQEQVYDTFSWAEDMIDLPDSLANRQVFLKVEEKPSFPGGNKEWSMFLRDNLNDPEEAKRNKYNGAVYLTFAVLKNGLVANPVVVESPHPSLTKEALRVLRKSPNWNPGTSDGEPIDSEMQIRIVFRTK